MAKIYHVALNGCDRLSGGEKDPFRTINHAASVALPGDTVRVHEGEYREWVDPQNSGLSESARITYEAAPGERVVIKGSEVIKGWEVYEGTVWVKKLPNAMFPQGNPFAETVDGDWLISPKQQPVHTGDVYLNGVSMYEAFSVEEVKQAKRRESGHQIPWFDHLELIVNPDQTIYQWYAEVGEEETTLWVNFHDHDPNEELVEINVRKYCFYPSKTGVNYITLRGFEICQAASPWAPPTADQPGMIGAHWSKCWIIENNHIHDAKCSSISLGKEISTGHNLYSLHGRKPGYQYQMEAVFLGLQAGWCRERVGSHIVRNNEIHDCGQNGVVGHMGCAFSRIEHNHIYNIGVKREYFGYEIGGIKLHAAVDVVIENNHIHDCELGTWLDWQAQGTRVTRNVYYKNDRDLMIEVTHGPCLVDNNVFASPYVFENMAQGTALVHNLFAGYTKRASVLDRATPYHYPHTTAVAGCAVVYSGDDRLFNNLYTGTYDSDREGQSCGTCGYDNHTTHEEYVQLLTAEGNTDEAKYYKVPQPVYVESNVYGGYAKPFRAEKDALCVDEIGLKVECENDACYVCVDVPAEAAAHAVKPLTTPMLGMPRITEEAYENPDGSCIEFNVDLCGEMRSKRIPAGPFANLKAGENRILVWEK